MKRFVEVTLRGVDLEVSGEYYPGTSDVFYLSNGDPGFPGDPTYFEVQKIAIGAIDVTALIGDDSRLFEEIVAAAFDKCDKEFRQYEN